MAEGSGSVEQQTWPGVRIGLLECGICLEEVRQPRALDCLHSFCLACLQSLAPAGRPLVCPQCRRPTRKAVGELERDFRLEQLKELRPLLMRGLEQLSAEATTRSSEILASPMEEAQLGQAMAECDRQLRLLEADEAAYGAAFRRHLRRWRDIVRGRQAGLWRQIDRRSGFVFFG